MQKKILLGSVFVLILLLLMPSIPAIQQKTIEDKAYSDFVEKLKEELGEDRASEFIDSVESINLDFFDELRNIFIDDEELSNRIKTLFELNDVSSLFDDWEDNPTINLIIFVLIIIGFIIFLPVHLQIALITFPFALAYHILGHYDFPLASSLFLSLFWLPTIIGSIFFLIAFFLYDWGPM